MFLWDCFPTFPPRLAGLASRADPVPNRLTRLPVLGAETGLVRLLLRRRFYAKTQRGIRLGRNSDTGGRIHNTYMSHGR